MAYYLEPYEQDQFIIKRIQPVTDGDRIIDANGDVKGLLRPSIKGGFDSNKLHEVALIKKGVECPIAFENIANTIVLLFNGVAPLEDKTDLEFRHNQKGNQLFLMCRDPILGGISKNVATISMLSPTTRFPVNFGQNLATTYDKNTSNKPRIDNKPRVT